LEESPDASLKDYLASKGYHFIVIGRTPEEWERLVDENRSHFPGCENDDDL
jgi:hypothetical protein